MAIWTSKYGTKIDIPAGLTVSQINEIKTQADNKYGTKAQELAKKYGAAVKQPVVAKPAVAASSSANTSSDGITHNSDGTYSSNGQVISGATSLGAARSLLAKNGGDATDGKVPSVDLGVQNNGTIDNTKATSNILGAEEKDVNSNVKLGNANETDEFGNSVKTVLNPDGSVSRTKSLGAAGQGATNKFVSSLNNLPTNLDLNGAPKILETGDYRDSYNKNQQALYNLNTQYLDRNQSRDLEAQKQELANRGIIYNPRDKESGYGKAIGSINEDYANQRQTAFNNSIAGADSRLATEAGVQSAAGTQFTDRAKASFTAALQGNEALGRDVSQLNGSFQPYQATSTDTSGELGKILQLEQNGQITAQDAQIRREALAKSAKNNSSSSSSSGFQIT